MSEKPIRELVTKAEMRITGRRFCSSCQYSKPLETGAMRGEKYPRWLCKECLERTIRRELRKNAVKDDC